MSDKNYVVYHLHSDYSLTDSATKMEDYIDKMVENGHKAVAFTEHGNIYNWISKKRYCEEKGIKYIHGIEIYVTDKSIWKEIDIDEYGKEYIKETKKRRNFHTILLAKNYKGVEEINNLITLANQEDRKYFNPRILFSDFLGISDNVIKISACLASPLNKLRKELKTECDEKRKNEISRDLDLLLKHYDYYEIQPHIKSEEQKEYNLWLLEQSKKYNKPLVAGTDTHSLNKYYDECRKVLQRGTRWSSEDYANESEFDLTYKTYYELVDMFEKQGVLSEEVYLQAIENTNIIADSVEDFELDRNNKYPILYDDDVVVCENRIKDMFLDKIENGVIPLSQKEKYIDAIKEEWKVFNKINMVTFMLSMSETLCWCRDNGIQTGPLRGSVGGSRIAYVLDIIDCNPEDYNLVFSRFANEDRVEIGDIDVDVNVDERPMIYKHMFDTFGTRRVGHVLAIGTVKDKGTIDLIGRGLKNKDGSCVYTLKEIAKIKKEFSENEEKTKSKYKDLFYYFDGLNNTKVSQSIHPAGIVVSCVDLINSYGAFINKDGLQVLQIDMEDCHYVGLCKYDFLALKQVQILEEISKSTNTPYPKYHTINWTDENVWKDLTRSSIGIFQFEEPYSFQCLKKFNCTNINDITLVTAAIRPGGASYREELLNRVIHKNPSVEIDKILSDSLGFLVFQESVSSFLQNICGFSGSEADTIRRAIASKKIDKINEYMPKIIDGYCNHSSNPRNVAEEEVKEFVKVIEDSSSYMFGKNHATGYSLITYLCAYYRYYYTYEFICAYLNHAANEKDIIDGQKLAEMYGIVISNPKFRFSKDVYYSDKENKKIYKGLYSIKFISKDLGRAIVGLYENTYSNFLELLDDLYNKCHINSKQLSLLIKVEFFSEFGNINTLLKIVDMYEVCKRGEIKQINYVSLKNNFPTYIQEKINRYATTNTGNTYKFFDVKGFILDCYLYFTTHSEEDRLVDKIIYQQEILGDVNLYSGKEEDRFRLIVLDIEETKRKSDMSIYGYDLLCLSIGSGKKNKLKIWKNQYDSNPIKKFSVIEINNRSIEKETWNDIVSWRLKYYTVES